MTRPLKVLKFGGTSVGSADRLRRVVEIVQAAARTHQAVVVVSAASGVTDRLVAAWDQAGMDGFDPNVLHEHLLDRYRTLASGLLQPEGVAAYEAVLRDGLAVLPCLFRSIAGDGPQPHVRDELLALGERVSVPLVARALREAGLVSEPADAAELVRTDDRFGDANVDLDRTYKQIRRWHSGLSPEAVPIVTGFIGATAEGAVTTLGRGGSDYSAALLASALKAEFLERWTDVDGIYTEDPRKSRNAKRLACVVLEEAWSWNQAGRLGMHRKALDPLVVAGIAVHVRCTETPDQPGTLILPAGHERARAAVGL